MEQAVLQRVKWLTQALIISASLNIGLLATFITFVFKEKQPPLPKPAVYAQDKPPTNVSLLRTYCTLPLQELLLHLEDRELAEDGYAKRDLALACLVSFHHFNLDRALGTKTFPNRLIGFTDSQGLERIEIPLFQGFTDFQFEAILHYAKTEKWPFTTKGLFYELKKSGYSQDSSLVDAFCLTFEYETFALIFAKTGHPVEKERIIQLIRDGEWETLAECTAAQRRAIDLSPAARRSLLLSYLNFRSTIAADLLLSTDLEFALKRFDDAQILVLIQLLSPDHPQLGLFAKQLLVSPRSDAIWRKAGEILYTQAHQPIPVPFNVVQAVERFCPQETQAITTSVIETKIEKIESLSKKKIHIVQEGESLWKIARKYHTSVESLMKINRLENEKLRVGRKLEIPESPVSSQIPTKITS